MAELVDKETGKLVYGDANIAQHMFTREFLEKMATAHLPCASACVV
jgi:hypothetical protein